ncbi:MAG: type II toxin-antitoxin system RelE/ParE family toxin [Terriglobales bacterium]|jgi:plasmid stabilization system protein ParE
MSSRGSKSGRACLRNRDTPGCLDTLEARAWYDNIRPELGERFALAVEATVEAMAEHPVQFPVVYRSRRRAGVRRFPYGIFFEVQEHRIVVIACFHGKRNPRRWQSR